VQPRQVVALGGTPCIRNTASPPTSEFAPYRSVPAPSFTGFDATGSTVGAPAPVAPAPGDAPRGARVVPHPGQPEISVVVPAFDEIESLPPLVDEVEEVMERLGRSWELVLVDDGSTDGTADWIARTARLRTDMLGVMLERNGGQSAALVAGLDAARGTIVVTLDADGQNDPADIPGLIAALDDADVVSGVRVARADTARRRLSSRIANTTRRLVLGDRITDIGCSMKAYRREAIANLPVFNGVHRFLPALCQLRGARIVEVPVAHRPRRAGQSKYGIANRMFRGIHDLFGVAWLRSRLLTHRVREVIRHVE